MEETAGETEGLLEKCEGGGNVFYTKDHVTEWGGALMDLVCA